MSSFTTNFVAPFEKLTLRSDKKIILKCTVKAMFSFSFHYAGSVTLLVMVMIDDVKIQIM